MGSLKPHQIITATLILMTGVSVVEALAPGYAMPFVIVILLSLLLAGNSKLLTRSNAGDTAGSFAKALSDFMKAALQS